MSTIIVTNLVLGESQSNVSFKNLDKSFKVNDFNKNKKSSSTMCFKFSSFFQSNAQSTSAHLKQQQKILTEKD